MRNKNDFWFYSLCVLLIIACANGWNIFMRIAVTVNAVLVLMSSILKIRSFSNGRSKEA